MRKYKKQLEAYRLHPEYETMETEANILAVDAIDSSIMHEIRLVQTCRAETISFDSKDLSIRKRNKAIRQFHKNIIVPRRIILLFLYSEQSSMEQFCKFLSGGKTDKYYDAKANIWGCTKLKKAMHILDFGFRVTRQASALNTLDLPLSKHKGDFLPEEMTLLTSYSKPPPTRNLEVLVAKHMAGLEAIREQLQSTPDATDAEMYRKITDYLEEHGILENKELTLALGEHFNDRLYTTTLPRIMLY